jgi:hypothetical protein
MDERVGALVAAVEALPRLGDPEGVAALLAAQDLLAAVVCESVDELDRSGLVGGDGA